MAAHDDVLDQDQGDALDGAVERVAETVLPTRHGPFRMLGYRDQDGMAHVALVRGRPTDDAAGPEATPLVRVHSECLTGDALGSFRCDCGEQLDAAMAAVAAEGRGAIIYVRGHEGRGIGILEKLRAYGLQDDGVDTVDANLALGHVADARSYEQSALILADLGIGRIRLLSANPAKEHALRELGIDVLERTPLLVPARAESTAYLHTKRERMGHDRPVPPTGEQPAADTVPDSEWAALLQGSVPRSGEELTRRYGPLVAAGELLTVAQLGQSLDGFIASRTGDAEFVTGPEDRQHLHRLRALVDAVLVGVGTACSDDCRLTVRDVPGPSPVRVLLDPSARAPRTCQLLTDGAARTLWLVGPTAGVGLSDGLPDHVEVVALPDDDDADPQLLLRLLHERGLTRVLVEGGGRVVSAFIAAGVLDRLLVTTAPVLIGDGVPGVRFDGQDALAGALRGPVRRFTLGEDVCTEIELGTAMDR